ncbi:unnamed protein product [Penicillium palitans]
MKFPVDFALFATLAALGSAASISASPHDANRPLIATADDIPDLPEGFTWEIVKQPRGNDTSVKTTVSNTDLQPEGLPERAMGISCQGHPARPPLWDDCHVLQTMIQNYGSTVLVHPGWCHQSAYGSCLAYVCAAKCRQVAVDTTTWARIHGAIMTHCVGFGECGIANDKADNQYEIGIEHTGDELPAYHC